MNERIKELAIEARLIAPEYSDCTHTTLSPQEQKFAELIVRECCLVLEQTQTALDRHKWPTPSECGIYIKEHFGVEE